MNPHGRGQGQPSGPGMGGGSLQDIQRLQQQLQAQYGRQQQQHSHSTQQQQQQQGTQPGAQQMPGMPVAPHHMQNPQQAAFASNPQYAAMAQQQSQQSRGQMSNTALGMMQQQNAGAPNQGQGGGGMMSPGGAAGAGAGSNNNSASMYSNWNGMQGGTTSSMDASSASSARLAAMAGMGMNMGGNSASGKPGGGMMGNTSSSSLENMRALLQNQQSQQQQGNQGQGGQQQGQRQNQSGNTANFHPSQQGQQQQGQQQQGQQQQHHGGAGGSRTGMMGHSDSNSGGGGAPTNSQQLLLQQQLVNLRKQMQQGQQQGGSVSANAAASAMHSQQGSGGGGGGGGMQGNAQAGQSGGSGSSNSANLMQAQQQQFLQQMQQQRAGGNPAMLQQMSSTMQQDPNNGMGGLLRPMSRLPQRGSMTGGGMNGNNSFLMQSLVAGQSVGQNSSHQQLVNAGARGSLNEQQLLIHQQNLIKQAGQQSGGGSDSHSQSGASDMNHQGQQGNMQQQMNSGSSQANSFQQRHPGAGIMDQRHPGAGNMDQHSHGNMDHSQSGPGNMDHRQSGPGNMSQMGQHPGQQNNGNGGGGGGGGGGSTGGNTNNSMIDTSIGSANMPSSSNMPTPMQNSNSNSQQQQNDTDSASQKSFLDGRFAGGWQSNSDLPDRRRVIFSILEVIQQMRPETSNMAEKLPHMAKSLEEHLYRSAQSKEEYLDLATLKHRLQTIAHGLELHRTSSTTSMKRSDSVEGSQNFAQAASSHQAGFGGNSQTAGGAAPMGGQQQNAPWSNSGSGNTGGVSSSNMANLAAHLNRGSTDNMSHQGSTNNLSNQGSMSHHGSTNNLGAQSNMSHQESTGAQRSLANNGALNNNNNADLSHHGSTNNLGSQANMGGSHHSSTNNVDAQRNVPQNGAHDNSRGQMNQSQHGSTNSQHSASQHGSFGNSGSNHNTSQHASFVNSGANTPAALGQQKNESWSAPGGALPNPNVSNLSAQMNPPNSMQGQQNQGGMNNMQGQQNLGSMNNMPGQQNQGGMNNMPGQQNSLSHPGSFNNMASQQHSNSSQHEMFGNSSSAQLPVLQNMDSSWSVSGSLSMPPPSGGGNSSVASNSQYQQDNVTSKKKVILQQQQRLLLLRHASKCKVGPGCTTKFCSQMVTLWNHMKGCRNKNCETSHCRSSRCVLNHYRICKSQGKTATCEVCGPVMAKIKRQERDFGGIDPLAKDQQEMSSEASMPDIPGMSNQSEQYELQQLQAQQLKLQGQLDSLKQLQKQQEQLLEQQRRLQEQAQHIKDPASQQAQQVQQQQMLLQQLQKRCHQQQLLLQQALQIPPTGGGDEPDFTQGGMNQNQQGQSAETVAPAAAPSSLSGVPTGRPVSPAKKQRKNAAAEGKGKRVAAKGKRNMGKGKVLPKVKAAVKTEGIAPLAKNKRSTSQSTPKERAQKKCKPVSVDSAPKAVAEMGASSKDDDGSSIVQADSPQNLSLVSGMTRDAIEKHLESLNKQIRLSSRTVTHKCLPVIQDLIDDEFGWVFHDAVDPVALGLPDYFDVVKTPMHLELVKKKLDNAVYSDMDTFARDAKLVFENAILYNGENSEVGALAQSMVVKLDKLFSTLVQGIESSQQNLETQGVACSLCGTQKRCFEPTVLCCQGQQCGMQRIKRHAAYFTDRTKQNHWCASCYDLLKSEDTIVLDDGGAILKKELQEFKNDALPEEAWVNCDQCHSWVHQICALFNGRTNKSTATYTCPTCHLKKESPVDTRTQTERLFKGAEDLTHCNMSMALEKGLSEALSTAYKGKAKELGIGVDQVEKAGGLTVRVVSNMEKKHFVGEEMLQRYPANGRPTEFPVRSKCISLFQKIHGVDTLLFSMYVYEYGHDCPAPNRRRVYISYLDSVQYFEPKCYRTVAYQAILVEYLRYVKERGFHTAHIWSCPPTPGDDYIFHSHPSHQLIPHEDMLRTWYHQMLTTAKAQGVVIRTTTLYDEYFTSDGGNNTPKAGDPTCLPYFEGDYIPGELENIIKVLKRDGHGSNDKSTTSQDEVMRRLGHNLSKMKDNFIVVHLRNRRFAAAVERGEDVSEWLEDSDDELVRSKRAKISGKGLREFSADSEETTTQDRAIATNDMYPSHPALAPIRATKVEPTSENQNSTETGAQVVGQGAVPGESKSPVDETSKTDPVSESAVDELSKKEPQPEVATEEDAAGSKAGMEVTAGEVKAAPDVNDSSASPLDTSQDTGAPVVGTIASKQPGCTREEASVAFKGETAIGSPITLVTAEHAKDASTHKAAESREAVANSSTEQQPINASLGESGVTPKDISPSSKRGIDEIGPALSRHAAGMKNRGPKSPVAGTADADEPMESEMFESRQQFLNYCLTNHCQFDELRKTKHSTMMVLFQLHNPMAPLFLNQCGACYRDITHGVRYHCNDCSNFDLCQECYEPVTTGLWAQRDPRFAHPENHSFKPLDMEALDETQKTREERQRSLKSHLDLLEHVASCDGPPNCSLQNCQRMKKLFEHVSGCEIKPKKECKVCTRLYSLCSVHARSCGARESCPIPFCDRIRESNKRRRQQQQLMDDRRRRAQNELYHAGGSEHG